MKILDNVNQTVRDDLVQSIQKDSKLSIAAACFSIYAYQELKKQLDSVDEIRFIFPRPPSSPKRHLRPNGNSISPG